MDLVALIPLISLPLILIGIWFLFRESLLLNEQNVGSGYPKSWSKKTRCIVTSLWILAVGVYLVSFIYGFINVMESDNPFTGHHIYHLAIGVIIIFLLLLILFFFFGAYVREWGIGLKTFFVSIVAAASVMIVFGLIVYLISITFNLSNVMLGLISSFLAAGIPVLLLAFLLYSLFSRE